MPHMQAFDHIEFKAFSLTKMSKRYRAKFINWTLVTFILILGLMVLLQSPVQVQHALIPVHHLEEPIGEDLVWQLEQELPEVDYGFWYRHIKPNIKKINKSCAEYPDPIDLQLHNVYWQTYINGNVTFRLFAAYLDQRIGVEPSTGLIRILATANQNGYDFPITYCQLWYEDQLEPILVQISEYENIWPIQWGQYTKMNYPHLLSCPLPEQLPTNINPKAIPRTVSLVSRICDSASNSLRVHNEKSKLSNFNESINSTIEPNLSFGICLKAFEFPFMDRSQRLIEWVELQRLLGASRIYGYIYDVQPEMKRVLDYYQGTGYMELRPLTMANGMPRLRHYHHLLLKERLVVKRLNELIPYNDCFYRHMNRHDYLLNIDIDELMMPMGELRSWQQLIDITNKMNKDACPNGIASMCLLHTHFSKLISKELKSEQFHFLQRTLRQNNHSQPYRATKCFHNTRSGVTLHNHITIKQLPGRCVPRTLTTNLAQLQHYQDPSRNFNLSQLIEDRNAWKFEKELREAVKRVIKDMN